MQISKVMNWNRFGFTLIELMVVILIISLFLGLGIPKVLESFAESDLSKTTRNISLFIEQTRSNCILHKKSSYLLFELSKKMISTPDLDNREREIQLKLPKNIKIQIEYQDKIYSFEPIKIEVSNFGYLNPIIIHLKKREHNQISIYVNPFLLKNNIIFND